MNQKTTTIGFWITAIKTEDNTYFFHVNTKAGKMAINSIKCKLWLRLFSKLSVLPYVEWNQLQTKSKIKLKSFKFFNNQCNKKVNTKNNKCNCIFQDKARMIQIRMLGKGTQCKEHYSKKLILDFGKLKTKFEKIKKTE